MSTAVTAVFLVLMATEALGTASSLLLYLRSSGWRDTAVGRHLAAYMGALLGLYAVTFVALFVHSMVVVIVVLACHAAFAGVIWQRTVLIWRGQHSDDDG